MAGIKITDLPSLAAAEATDYLCIVDVSDTSGSPEGTTKKIEYGNVGSLSGNWTPSITETINVGAVIVNNFFYQKNNNAMICWVDLSLNTLVADPDDFSSFKMTLPYGSDLTNVAIGTGSNYSSSNGEVGIISINENFSDFVIVKITNPITNTGQLGDCSFTLLFNYLID